MACISSYSEAAKTELLNECEKQFTQLQLIQNDIILAEPELCENLEEQVMNRLIAVEAELKQWQILKPKLLSPSPEVLLVAGKEEVHRLNSDLEMVLSCCQAKRDKLQESLICEQKWLEEKKEVLIAARDHVDRLQDEKERLSEQSVLLDMKSKIQKMKDYQDKLMETLGDVLEGHFPLPQHESDANKKKKNIPLHLNDDLISLNEILELLMNKALDTPHDPYVTVDDTFWPPYIEMLLRYGIAIRNPEDCAKIRLETFC
ncbi:centromere protein K [Aplochiton taeniatus]